MRSEAHVSEWRASISQILNAYTNARGLLDEYNAKNYAVTFADLSVPMGTSNDEVSAAELAAAIAALTAVLGGMTAAQRNALFKIKN